MEILSVERIPVDDLLSSLRQVRLFGFDQAQPYLDASIELVPQVATDELWPAQNYLLTGGVTKILELREALHEHGVELFDLAGGLLITTSEAPGEQIPVIPPIVEESLERDGETVLLINDGIHRISAARRCGMPISVVVVRGVPPEYPYYAYARPTGWEGISEFEELPKVFQKKDYRQPTGYQALFRDFNGLFPGVQKQRAQTNPDHLKM